MITVSILDVDLKNQFSQLFFAVSPLESHVLNDLPQSFQVQQKEFRIVLRDGQKTIGSLKLPQQQITKPLNLVRWLTLFDPNDDCYDGDFSEDDLEQPRVLIRLDSRTEVINLRGSLRNLNQNLNLREQSRISQIMNDYKEMQKRYNLIKEDLLHYRDMAEEELRMTEKETQMLQNENKQLREQMVDMRMNYENFHQESLNDIQQKLSTLGDDLVQEQGMPQNLVEKIKKCFQNINSAYDSLGKNQIN